MAKLKRYDLYEGDDEYISLPGKQPLGRDRDLKERDEYEWEKELDDIPVNDPEADMLPAETASQDSTASAAEETDHTDSLSDEEWAKALRDLEWIWEKEAEAAAERQQK